MTLFIKDNIVRFEISENDVLLVQILKRQYDFSSVNSCDFDCKSTVVGKCHPHVSTWGIAHNQVESGRGLEGVVQADYELVRGQR